MKRAELEHIIRPVAAITNQRDIIVIRSRALLAQFPDAPAASLASMEADVFPKDRPILAIQIDGTIGERSLSHETFGYHARGVDEITAMLPDRRQQRLVPICNDNTGGATGRCLKAHYLALSKLAAGRDKDIEFVRILIAQRMVDPDRLEQLLPALNVPPGQRELAQQRLGRIRRSL